jgi:hypothetical protein
MGSVTHRVTPTFPVHVCASSVLHGYTACVCLCDGLRESARASLARGKFVKFIAVHYSMRVTHHVIPVL